MKKDRDLCQRRLASPGWSEQAGMMTVEVSVIIPLLFFLIAAILFFQFFMIDMASAKSLAMRGATEAAASWKTGGDPLTKDYNSSRLLERDRDYLVSGQGDETMVRKTEIRMESLAAGRWILSEARSAETGLQNDQVRIGRQLLFKIPLAGSSRYMGVSGWKFRCLQSAAVDNWEESLRREMNRIE